MHRTPNRQDQKIKSTRHIRAKTYQKYTEKESVLKSTREKTQVTYKEKPIRIIRITAISQFTSQSSK